MPSAIHCHGNFDFLFFRIFCSTICVECVHRWRRRRVRPVTTYTVNPIKRSKTLLHFILWSQVQCRFRFHQMRKFVRNLSRPKMVGRANGNVLCSHWTPTLILWFDISMAMVRMRIYFAYIFAMAWDIPCTSLCSLLCLENPVVLCERKSVHICVCVCETWMWANIRAHSYGLRVQGAAGV